MFRLFKKFEGKCEKSGIYYSEDGELIFRLNIPFIKMDYYKFDNRCVVYGKTQFSFLWYFRIRWQNYFKNIFSWHKRIILTLPLIRFRGTSDYDKITLRCRDICDKHHFMSLRQVENYAKTLYISENTRW